MAGLGGTARTPGQPARTRRNFDGLTDPDNIVGSDGGLQLSNAGVLSILLDPSEPGLQLTSGLKILLTPTDSLLILSTSGLGVDADELFRRHQIWG